jgi:glycosyltransferase involved in cell wall biosynthesis
VNSLIIPVYKNYDSLPDVFAVAADMNRKFNGQFEVVFVVDGSPDRSAEFLANNLPSQPFASQLVLLSRNFGSFAAIRKGLEVAKGKYFAVMAADLQEPPELVIESFQRLHTGHHDIVVGVRESREDGMSSLFSRMYWWAYRKFVIHDIPAGGVDIFACNVAFRDHLLTLNEINTSLIGQIFWLGFRRAQVTYARRKREHGRSAWTLRKKLKYLTDSVFSFSDLPIRALILTGFLGLVVAITFTVVIVLSRLTGEIQVPGYSATVTIVSFFAALNSFGLATVGAYAWRAYENTKGRPTAVVLSQQSFLPRATAVTPGRNESVSTLPVS